MGYAIARSSPRLTLKAEVQLRGERQNGHTVMIRDLSTHGCCLDVVYRVKLDERLWVKLPGIEPIEAFVCWENEFVAGVEFMKPLHPAVLTMLADQIKKANRPKRVSKEP